ncbi:L-seryl-tRNA(Sec) kinase isoform X1 [Aedes aegypti]|uniref:L-seryl-tRNA(Sec) kinase n=3 Tax=Aedes aegypti TaxID=7159 RepID=A0A903TTC7_AEDAE|nr:L-seryl-tRNA(Sec) kinase isoform X1 [Aedes aegypti]
MNKVCFVVLIGIPGAGKTTFCERFQQIMLEKYSMVKVVHVCFDKFIRIGDNLDLETGHMKKKRKQLLRILEKVVEGIKLKNRIEIEEANDELTREFNENIHLDLDHKEKIYSLFLDDNMYYRSMRYEILALARKHRTGFLQLHFNVSLMEAKARNSERSNPIPEDTMSRMWIKLEKPNGHFYRWEKNTVDLLGNNNLDDLETVEQRIIQCTNSPECPIEQNEVREPVEQSTIHKVDLLLRKAVSDVIKHQKALLNGADLKLFTKQLVCKRKAILNDLKLGLIDVDPQCATKEQIELLF